MDAELEIIDCLKSLEYTGKCAKIDELTTALKGGTRSAEFRELVAWLAQELHILRKTDESVNKECDDPSEFAMELSAMLKELGCSYGRFVTGPLSERFESKVDRLQLLEYMITELMATKMALHLKPTEKTYVIPKSETHTAKAMEQLTKDLCLGKPPDNISPKALFDKLNFKVEEKLRSVKPGVVCEPLMKLNKPLTDAQWSKLQELHEDLDSEYNLRRQVLLTRLEVTIQSFQWSDSMRSRENEIIEKYQRKLKDIEPYKYGGTDTDIVALLSARSDLAIIEKTSSANVRRNTACKIQKHVMGSVPDRGGRAHEHAPPPPEMPSWQQQRASGPGGRGGGGNFRGGRGGFGGAGGGGGGGGGNWQQYSQPQRQPQQNFNQTPQRDQNWIQGTGRVQGSGWTQGGTGGGNYQGGRGDGNYQGDRDNRGGGSGGGNFNSRSNYNRGGGSRR